MKNSSLFAEYNELSPNDFDMPVARVCFIIIKNLYLSGVETFTPAIVDQEVNKYARSNEIYQQNGGLDFLKTAYEFAEPKNFDYYYQRLKKTALLRELRKKKYDISDFYVDAKEIDDPLQEIKIQKRFDNASVDDILNKVESNFNVIRKEFVVGRAQHDPSIGINELITELEGAPDIGPSLEGDIFSDICRGGRAGCLYLKSASSASGKTRTSVFDACRLVYPIHQSETQQNFCRRVNATTGEINTPVKVLFIVTEMDMEELQTIILAYLSGVNEAHILTGAYQANERERVLFAAKVMQYYHDYFIIEEVPEPDLTNVAAAIKKYATVDGIQACFFDYIHSTPSMINQFARSNLREDVVLMLMANQLKQLAKDYKIFISTATQVNASGMQNEDLSVFKNETSIRGAKSIADKADVGFIMTKIDEKSQRTVAPTFTLQARSGNLRFFRPPTHVLDVYKMRRGQYKNVRIQSYINLGTGEREDEFITRADNTALSADTFTIFVTDRDVPIEDQERVDDITKLG